MRSVHRMAFSLSLAIALPWTGSACLAEAGINVWTSLNTGLTDTQVQTLAIDPQAPTTLYAGTWYGGVFKTTDGAANWRAVNAGLPGNVILALVIDPQTPTTLYAGMFSGVFKSTNGGGSWSAVNGGLAGQGPVYALAIDPQIPTTLYAGTVLAGGLGGVFKSTDGGNHWSAGLAGRAVFALTVDPVTPTTLYAGTIGGVFKSTNGGENWGAASNGIPASCWGHSLAIDPLTPTTVYAGTGCGTGSGVFKSTDGGSNWSAVNIGMPAWYVVEALAIDPTTPATLYRGTGEGVFETTNGGGNWSDFNTGLTNTDVTTLAMDPLTPTTLYVGTLGGGVFKRQQFNSLVAAVLPASRSVQVGSPATAFVTVINTGASTATSVGISLPTGMPASFTYQTTDPLTNAVTGTPNTPADIRAGQSQTYVIALTAWTTFGPTDVAFAFGGANTMPVTTLVGINTLLLAASATPTPDIVALAATLDNDGIVNAPNPAAPSPMAGVFAVATVNVGAGGAVTVSADTGGVTLPLRVLVCETDPASGACTTPIGPTVRTQIAANATPTFGVFVNASGIVPFAPASNRIFVRFEDSGGVIRGATSVAVRTQ